MNKFSRSKAELEITGSGSMKAFGSSMLPILKSGSKLTFIKQDAYEIGDIVFSKVKGRYIDAHKIIRKESATGFLIANNHGHENGWTKIVYGKVIEAEFSGKIIYQKQAAKQ